MQGRSQKKIWTEAISMNNLWLRQSVHGWVLFLGFRYYKQQKPKKWPASVGLLLAMALPCTSEWLGYQQKCLFESLFWEHLASRRKTKSGEGEVSCPWVKSRGHGHAVLISECRHQPTWPGINVLKTWADKQTMKCLLHFVELEKHWPDFSSLFWFLF